MFLQDLIGPHWVHNMYALGDVSSYLYYVNLFVILIACIPPGVRKRAL